MIDSAFAQASVYAYDGLRPDTRPPPVYAVKHDAHRCSQSRPILSSASLNERWKAAAHLGDDCMPTMRLDKVSDQASGGLVERVATCTFRRTR